jgi:hypothetical protein
MTTQLYVLNSDNSVNWENYRLYIQQRKYKWANTESYYSNKKKWGEIYGYTILNPYTKEEVDYVCRKKGITLPNDLINYLTTVSSQFFITGYPEKFCLSHLRSKEVFDKINIPITKLYFTDDDFYYKEDVDDVNANDNANANDNENREKVDITNKFEVSEFFDCMYSISEGGCAFSDNIYLGAGERNGSIWNYGDDNQWSLTASSLTDYIINNFYKC